MYEIKVILESSDKNPWGEFKVVKRLDVKQLNVAARSKSPAASASAARSKSPAAKATNVCGFVVQYVTKKTVVYALCEDNNVRQISSIDDFTSDRVKYMNHSYYELFPILNGKSIYNDSFSNGAVLRYSKRGSLWISDNNPPTMGKIDQEGIMYFIPDHKANVENVINIIDNSTKKRSSILMNILGINWDLNPTMPANGLPYMETHDPDVKKKLESKLESLSNSKHIKHTVTVVWDGIKPYKNTNSVGNNTSNKCNPIKEKNNVSNKRDGTTIIAYNEIIPL